MATYLEINFLWVSLTPKCYGGLSCEISRGAHKLTQTLTDVKENTYAFFQSVQSRYDLTAVQSLQFNLLIPGEGSYSVYLVQSVIYIGNEGCAHAFTRVSYCKATNNKQSSIRSYSYYMLRVVMLSWLGRMFRIFSWSAVFLAEPRYLEVCQSAYCLYFSY